MYKIMLLTLSLVFACLGADKAEKKDPVSLGFLSKDLVLDLAMEADAWQQVVPITSISLPELRLGAKRKKRHEKKPYSKEIATKEQATNTEIPTSALSELQNALQRSAYNVMFLATNRGLTKEAETMLVKLKQMENKQATLYPELLSYYTHIIDYLTSEIVTHPIETGLYADPAMKRIIDGIQRYMHSLILQPAG